MTWAVLVINIKGGTGKSTVAEKLSKKLRDEGYKVGILDADIDSANLSSRLGVQEKISFKGDHTVEPVHHDGMKLYSMENTFEDSSFSQTGQFMRGVIGDMINASDWGDLDYMVVDCPPGSSDIFEELVRALRSNLLGAVSVGISDAVSDTARLVKVCSHNWIPILGFVENMSGVACHSNPVKCSNAGLGESHEIYPFGSGAIEEFSNNIGGNFLGSIPLCIEDTPIEEAGGEVLDETVRVIEEAAEEGGPELPEDNVGNRNFISNVWGTIKNGVKRMNEQIDVGRVQDEFGVEGREPLIIKLELTDATGLKKVLSSVIFTVKDGKIRPINPAKYAGTSVEGGIRITSQDLYDAIRGEKKVMRSVTGEITTEPYSIIDAVKMGDAEVWGDRTINRLAVLDRILSEAVTMDDVQKVLEEA